MFRDRETADCLVNSETAFFSRPSLWLKRSFFLIRDEFFLFFISARLFISSNPPCPRPWLAIIQTYLRLTPLPSGLCGLAAGLEAGLVVAEEPVDIDELVHVVESLATI